MVGVVKDSGANLLADADSIEAYVPIEGTDVERSALILHTRGDPAPLVRLIPSRAATVNETVSVTLCAARARMLLEAQRKMVILIGSIGAVATPWPRPACSRWLLSRWPSRKRELGIRIAIGASPRHILAILLAKMPSRVAGAVAGAILAAILSRLVRSLIVLQNRDTVDVMGFAAGLAVFVLAAAWRRCRRPCARYASILPTLREE